MCSGADYALNLAPYGKICIQIGANLASKFKKKFPGTAPSSGAIWDEFSWQN